ncbi:MAG: chorismate synthase [Bacteroidales bacterium]|jgi:chorismate synthase|nr:chorismate synthase [Bacteroidales bacterium]
MVLGNTFGKKFKIKSFGNSHDNELILEIYGMPEGILVDYDLIAEDLLRRRPKFDFDTPRQEQDDYIIIQGVENNITNGQNIVIKVKNQQGDSSAYKFYDGVFRPSHADFTWEIKYGEPLPAGGGIVSARETVLRVIAGAFAKMFLKKYYNDVIKFQSWTFSVGNLIQANYSEVLSDDFIYYLNEIRKEGDSIGGKVRCIIKGIPAGLGCPPFDKIQAHFAYSMMTIPAVKAFEIGRGVESSLMKGSEHNDPFYFDKTENKIKPAKNDAGGILGGITSGEDITITVSFKPISSIKKVQKTVNKRGEECELQINGNHDICPAVRGAVIVEAMAAITLADYILVES